MDTSIKELLKGATGRMEVGAEPSAEDWYLLRCLMSKTLFSKRKKIICDYLWSHLCRHHIDELNTEERFTLECFGCLTKGNTEAFHEFAKSTTAYILQCISTNVKPVTKDETTKRLLKYMTVENIISSDVCQKYIEIWDL